MSLLFGNLTQDFVSFAIVLNESKTGNATAIADLPIAAANFRKVAAQDASYLVYIGLFFYWDPYERMVIVVILQDLECLSAHTSTCVCGYTPLRSMQSVFGKSTFKPYCDRILNSLITSGLERLRPGFRLIPVGYGLLRIGVYC